MTGQCDGFYPGAGGRTRLRLSLLRKDDPDSSPPERVIARQLILGGGPRYVSHERIDCGHTECDRAAGECPVTEQEDVEVSPTFGSAGHEKMSGGYSGRTERDRQRGAAPHPVDGACSVGGRERSGGVVAHDVLGGGFEGVGACDGSDDGSDGEQARSPLYAVLLVISPVRSSYPQSRTACRKTSRRAPNDTIQLQDVLPQILILHDPEQPLPHCRSVEQDSLLPARQIDTRQGPGRPTRILI